MRDVYIVEAVRTPVGRGRPDGRLADLRPETLAGRALNALEPGETMAFFNDHDPLPLLAQIAQHFGEGPTQVINHQNQVYHTSSLQIYCFIGENVKDHAFRISMDVIPVYHQPF